MLFCYKTSTCVDDSQPILDVLSDRIKCDKVGGIFDMTLVSKISVVLTANIKYREFYTDTEIFHWCHKSDCRWKDILTECRASF